MPHEKNTGPLFTCFMKIYSLTVCEFRSLVFRDTSCEELETSSPMQTSEEKQESPTHDAEKISNAEKTSNAKKTKASSFPAELGVFRTVSWTCRQRMQEDPTNMIKWMMP